MAKVMVLVLWFAAGMLVVLSALTVFRSFMCWSGGAFDRFGPTWIVLKSLWYGAAASLLGMFVMRSIAGEGFSWTPLCVCALMVVADQFPRDEVWQRSFLDKGINLVGYQQSLMFPYVPQDRPLPSGTHPVIPPRTRVLAVTPLGKISITSGNGLLRTYEWDGVTRTLELFPPDRSPYGTSCFYSRRHGKSGVRLPSYDWKMHNGITRGETWESIKNFDTLEQATAWLKEESDATMPAVWRHDGFVVAWSTQVDDQALTIVVYQVLIKGKKPEHLPGSDDGKLMVQRTTT